jgi:DNA-binding transcriptional regulator YiaG
MPDKAGSRATSIAHFSQLITGWRKRRSLSRADAARLLCCTERTIGSWEAERSMPRGFTLRAIVAAIEGGAL